MGTKLDEENSSFGRMYKEGIYKLGQYAVYRAQRIWMYPNFIFKFTTVGRKQESILKILTSFRDRVIENRRNLNNNLNNNFIDELNDKENNNVELCPKKKMALLDLLLHAERDGIIDAKGISEEVDTFMFGGHDTVANTLQFTIMLLANHQDVQEKVVKECKEIFESSDRSATMADLAQMKYLECCIKESMRLYPPLPVITRKIEHPLKLEYLYCTRVILGPRHVKHASPVPHREISESDHITWEYEIPAGTECGILIFDLHRRSDQFVEPLKFLPERFLGDPTWHPYSYIPFSAGPRNCIGQKFAMMELKLTLSAVLRCYRLHSVTKPNDIIFVTDYVLRVKNPVYVKFEERI